uniref:Uncharacterized protein n=1 Tax=Arundo donax TaxID=35708 RepID=A0A0A8XR61_ARUDO
MRAVTVDRREKGNITGQGHNTSTQPVEHKEPSDD